LKFSSGNPGVYFRNQYYIRGMSMAEAHVAGFPRSTESIERALKFKIGFQDLEKVLRLAKICIKY